MGLLVLILAAVSAQTKIDYNTQVANLPEVVAVERSQCIGSGTGTTPDGAVYTWDCAGLQLYKIRLVTGKVLGPYVAIPATTEQAAMALWQPIPLSSPDPLPE